MPRRLLLVRHGESTWNAASRWQGQADPPLSPFGERQAEDAGARLAEIATITAVWASNLVRARRTGDLIAKHLGVAQVREEPRLRERDVGAWSGLTRFEGDDELLARTRAGLAAAVDGSGPGDMLVVTHGGVIRTIERSLGAIPERLPNLGGRWLLADTPTDLSLGERVVLLEPDEVTVPRGPSEQDPVRPTDATK